MNRGYARVPYIAAAILVSAARTIASTHGCWHGGRQTLKSAGVNFIVAKARNDVGCELGMIEDSLRSR